MNGQLAEIETVMALIQRLADELQSGGIGHVRRSANELRGAFEARGTIEPAVARMRESLEMLRRENHDGSRREFQRRAHGVDHLEHVLEQALLPNLRRVGFDV